jgi:HAMP domain-containing protein
VPNYDPPDCLVQNAVAQAGPAWTPIYPLVLAPIASTLAVTPVAPNNDLQGVLFATVPMTDVSEFLSRLEFSPNGQVFVIEPSGDLVATSTREETFTISGPPAQRQLHRVNVRQSQDPLTQAMAQELFDQASPLAQTPLNFSGPLAPAEVGAKPEQYFAKTLPYQDDRGLEWLIVTVVPASDFTAQIYANVRRTLMLCGLALVGSIASGIWTSRWITRSLLRLARATQNVAAGQLDQPLDAAPIQEIETLSDSFRQMVARLRQGEQLRQNYQQELIRQVAEKTAASTRPSALPTWEVGNMI